MKRSTRKPRSPQGNGKPSAPAAPPPPPSAPSTPPPADPVGRTQAWLTQQQTEFEKRNSQLDNLRRKLQERIEKQNQLLLNYKKQLVTPATDASGGDYLREAKRQLRKRANGKHRDLRSMVFEEDTPAQAGGDADAVASRYENKIRALEQEKVAIQGRMAELQRQLERSARVDAEALPAALTPRPSDRRFAVALLVGLLAGAAVIWVRGMSYQLNGILTAAPDKITPEDLSGQEQHLAEALAFSVTGGTMSKGLRVAQVSADPQTYRLTVVALAGAREAGLAQFKQLLDTYLDRLEQARLDSIRDARRTVEETDARIAALRHDYDDLLTKMANQALNIDVENPKQELDRLYSGLSRTRGELQNVTASLEDAREHLEVARALDVPERPHVDEARLRAAEAADQYLKEDLAALESRLTDLRNQLQPAYASADVQATRFCDAAGDLTSYLETQKLGTEDQALLAALEQFSIRVDPIQQVSSEFRKHWNHAGDSLKVLSVDPRRRDCLLIQQRLEGLLKGFDLQTQESLQGLQQEYQRFFSGLADPAQHFDVRNHLAKRISTVVQERLAFTGAVRPLLPTENFELDAVLHSVVGLTRRVEDRQKVIEAELAQTAREELRNDLAEEVALQEQKVRDLGNRREALFGEVLNLQDQLNGLLPYLAEHGATTEVIRYTPDQVEGVLARIGSLEQSRGRTEQHIEQLLSRAEPLQVTTAQAAAWPVFTINNIWEVGLGMAAGVIATYLLLWLFSAAFKSRSTVEP